MAYFEAMSACPRCGTENADTARFCNSCGYGLERPAGVALHVRKTVTVLFCDVTGSTALGERQDPERLRRVMTRYFEVAQETLERHQGKVEKFIGDAVMAVFGVPVLHEDDALRALRAAVGPQSCDPRPQRRPRANARRPHRGSHRRQQRGGDRRRPDARQLVRERRRRRRRRAARSAPRRPGEILIGEETYRLARDAIDAEPLEPLTVKGKRDRVMAYRLLEVVPGAPALARRFDSPMVGRTRELALLGERVLPRVPRGVVPPVHRARPGGRGEVAPRRGSARGASAIAARVLSGSCLPYGEGITFWPVLEIVKQLTGIADGDSPAEAREKIEAVLAGEPDAELVARARRRARRPRRDGRGRRGRLLGRAPPARGARAGAAARRRLRRSQLGRADAARSRRAHRRLVARRADPARRHGAPRSARRTSGLGRRQAQRDGASSSSRCPTASRSSSSRGCSAAAPSTPEAFARIQAAAEG